MNKEQPPTPPPGYRLVNVSERAHKGDLVFFKGKRCVQKHNIGRWSPNLHYPMAKKVS